MTTDFLSFRSALAVAALIAGLGACSGTDDSPAGDAGPTVVTGLSQDHVDEEVDYPDSPPLGGPHNPVWQNCGAYPDPILNELAVHSLEHGAVWIAYDPALGDDEVADLEGLAEGQTHVLVAPYPGLDSAVVATAWGVQQRYESVNEGQLSGFIGDYQQGAQTPELGAVCTRGFGEPR